MMLAGETSGCEDNQQADGLAAIVTQAFPGLPLGNRRVDRSGGDHVLLMVDDRIAFRFPRHGMHGLDHELALLRHLQRLSPIAIPDYQYVDPAGHFAGYPLIKGSALTPTRFRALSLAQQRDALTTAGGFLAVLHSLPAEMIAPMERWPTMSMPAKYASHGLTRHVPQIATQFPEQGRRLKAFYQCHRNLKSSRCVVVHGDLVAEHILWDEQAGQLSGIIDFADVALGDPAQDFLGFWAYGADAVRQLVELYPLPAKDTDLLSRSRSHFIRYRLDRLFEDVGTDAFDPGSVAAEIDALLAV